MVSHIPFKCDFQSGNGKVKQWIFCL